MKHSLLLLVASTFLVSCNPVDHYNDIIEDLHYIAYRTPLSSVGTGTIVQGKPESLIIYAEPSRCLPSKLEDGTPTQIRWEDNTDLPHHLKEVKFDFSTDLAFFGANGNPLFKFKAGASGIKKVEVKFSDAKVEFIDQLMFWKYFKSHMSEACQKAVTKYPLFWKTLKVGKMEYTFRNEVGATMALTAEGIKDIIDFSADASWSIKDSYTLVIDTPKYIGFLAAKLDATSIANEEVSTFSYKINSKGSYIWESAGESLTSLREAHPDATPIE